MLPYLNSVKINKSLSFWGNDEEENDIKSIKVEDKLAKLFKHSEVIDNSPPRTKKKKITYSKFLKSNKDELMSNFIKNSVDGKLE